MMAQPGCRHVGRRRKQVVRPMASGWIWFDTTDVAGRSWRWPKGPRSGCGCSAGAGRVRQGRCGGVPGRLRSNIPCCRYSGKRSAYLVPAPEPANQMGHCWRGGHHVTVSCHSRNRLTFAEPQRLPDHRNDACLTRTMPWPRLHRLRMRHFGLILLPLEADPLSPFHDLRVNRHIFRPPWTSLRLPAAKQD